jgi:hypothetical protein
MQHLKQNWKVIYKKRAPPRNASSRLADSCVTRCKGKFSFMVSKAQVFSMRHLGRGHLRALDGVRGLAVLMVLCFHALMSNYEHGGPVVRLIGETFGYGLLGVDFFCFVGLSHYGHSCRFP